MSSKQSSRLTKNLIATVHHVLMASTIASALLMLEATSFYSYVEVNLTHLVMGSLRIQSVTQASDLNLATSNAYPQVVLLPPPVQGIDIQRAVEVLTRRKVATIVVNFDMSQHADSEEFKAIQQARNAGIHIALGQPLLQGRFNNIPAVAAAPASDSTSSNLELDPVSSRSDAQVLEWAQQQCKAGIKFGYDESRWRQQIEQSGLSEVQFSPAFPSLGLVSGVFSGGTRNDSADPPLSRSSIQDFCTTGEKLGWSANDLSRWLSRAEAALESGQLESRRLTSDFFLTDLNIHRLSTLPDSGDPDQGLGAVPAGSTVFLGDDATVFRSFDEELVPLVAIYAAEFYSVQHPDEIAPILRWVSDVLVGVALGYLFHFLWGVYATQEKILETTPLTPLGEKTRRYLYARAALAVSLASLPVILYVLIRLSYFLLERQMWIDPVPVCIGMFCDALLGSRRQVHEHHAESLRELLTQHADIPLQLLFVLSVFVWAIGS